MLPYLNGDIDIDEGPHGLGILGGKRALTYLLTE